MNLLELIEYIETEYNYLITRLYLWSTPELDDDLGEDYCEVNNNTINELLKDDIKITEFRKENNKNKEIRKEKIE